MSAKKIIFYFVFSSLFSEVFCQAWVQESKFISNHRQEEDYYGWLTAGNETWVLSSSSADNFDSLGLDSVPSSGAVYIYKRNQNNELKFHQKINSSDRERSERFGWGLAIHDDILAVGAINNTTNDIGQDTMMGAGAVFVFRRNHQDKWIQEAKLTPKDRFKNEFFGWVVDVYNNTIVVGVPYKDEDTSGANKVRNTGACYIFVRDQFGNWTEQQKLTSSDYKNYDYFGQSVGIFDKVIAIGAPGQDTDEGQSNSKLLSGAAYIFVKDSNNLWQEKQKLVPKLRQPFTQFGKKISIDSNVLVCGVTTDNYDENGNNRLDSAGAAYIFEYSQGSWSQYQKIVAPDRAYFDYFGTSVDVINNLLLVGAIFEGEDSSGMNSVHRSGSVYVFKNQNSNWIFRQKLKAFDKHSRDLFGLSVTICDTMNLIVGSNNSFDLNSKNEVFNAGSMYSYSFDIYSGVEDNAFFEQELRVFPNPTVGELSVSFPEMQDKVDIRQVDVAGKVLQELSFSNVQQVEIDLLGSRGIYFLYVNSGKHTQVKKIIKN